ncbi:TipAS antibiotic-recognition domain-containing protein [Nesterenkonia halophila]|uniref:TipAS antibiotic-recognition domain-containing protein n=1 Tax=Nesterenkonia halophila TaxID=302044 RepID=UPI001FE9545F|nr:TipAS antibiotic-recognition domain-containing protein [Nesterenkonia halophila]
MGVHVLRRTGRVPSARRRPGRPLEGGRRRRGGPARGARPGPRRRADRLARRHARHAEESGDPATRAEYVRCLAHMYVDDARFAETYGGRRSGEFDRDALLAHLEG